MNFRFPLTLLATAIAVILPAAAQSLLKTYPLEGDVKNTRWTFLASQNPSRYPDTFPGMRGTMTVALPGYGAGMGLYSWTGGYSLKVNQPSSNTSSTQGFDIHQVVFQLDVTWDPATTFPASGGPKLSYNGGNQQIAATLPMIVDGTRVVENETGVPEMEDIESFSYRGITWQWDLSGLPENVQTVQIHMPFANHTSVVGAQIDVSSQFVNLAVEKTPVELWRETHFGSSANSGQSADDFDFDNDGLSNLVEYALGTSPVSSTEGRSAAPRAVMTAGRLALSFSLPASPPADAIYRVQVSDSLSGWRTLATKTGSGAWNWSGGGASGVTLGTAAAGRVPVTVADDTTGQQRRMMRLQIAY
ncbi:hypothetical protein OKA04_06630 [Luteolibacter flavescens]|uniref:Uncharacterized protein n=1 Tax=Luteolibacter flavescens TaxID=1859460 RepID=A0ABT3FLF7_9BACT|nr:hypothetical protein [Luteolibacter flavescens]MCW1884401.1 hypothetical protein [Luteolibacter flavescens]